MTLTHHQLERLRLATSGPVGILGGGPGCLHGDTPILDPSNGTTVCVKERELTGLPFCVYSLATDGGIVIAKASPPRRYTKERMLAIDLSSGSRVIVTERHRFFDGNSYVYARTISERLRKFGAFRLPSISERDLLARLPSVPNSIEKAGGFPGNYSAYPCPCGEPLPSSVEVFRSPSLLQVDALPCIHASLRSDGLVDTHSDIRRQQSFLLSMMGYVDHFEHQTGTVPVSRIPLEFHARYSILRGAFGQQRELRNRNYTNARLPVSAQLASAIAVNSFVSASSRSIQECLQGSSGQLTNQESVCGRFAQSSVLIGSPETTLPYSLFEPAYYPPLYGVGAFSDYSDWVDVVNVEDAGFHWYYDFSVPELSNYWAAGIFHHNTGKTFTVAALCKSLSTSIGLDQIAIGAPTGKAAVRVTETLSTHGIPLRARTWHSLLRGGTDGAFKFDRSNPLPFKVLISDESSMIDLDLMAAIFRARASGTLVLLVGDVNQLPPVGHGAPLRDLIAAGLPYGELTEIKRNSGGIVEACHAIRQGKRWTCGDNLRLVDCDSPEGQIKGMLANIRAVRADGDDPIWSAQVVCPVNRKSPLARKTLNSILQRELNAAGETSGTNPFRKGDKIVNTQNGRFPAVEFDQGSEEIDVSDRGELYVANGELARVLHVEDRLTIAQLDNPRRIIKIPRGKTTATADSASPEDSQGPGTGGDDDSPDKSTGTGCSWDLGYCLSVHRAQGSEWGTTICMIDAYPGARMICSREFWYTAISRAKTQCVLIGKKSIVDSDCRRQAIWRRKTLLKERILFETAKRELAEL